MTTSRQRIGWSWCRRSLPTLAAPSHANLVGRLTECFDELKTASKAHVHATSKFREALGQPRRVEIGACTRRRTEALDVENRIDLRVTRLVIHTNYYVEAALIQPNAAAPLQLLCDEDLEVAVRVTHLVVDDDVVGDPVGPRRAHTIGEDGDVGTVPRLP